MKQVITVMQQLPALIITLIMKNYQKADKAMIDDKVKEISKKQRNELIELILGVQLVLIDPKQIRAMMHKEIDWKGVLRYFCGTKQRANRSRSFRRINRKYPYIHPGRKTSHTSNIVIYIDQSGSVGDDDLVASI